MSLSLVSTFSSPKLVREISDIRPWKSSLATIFPANSFSMPVFSRLSFFLYLELSIPLQLLDTLSERWIWSWSVRKVFAPPSPLTLSCVRTGICENGGLVNQIGTYQIAVVAKASNTPFYVVTESHKFLKLFPLNQYDICAPVYINVTGERVSTGDRVRSRSMNNLSDTDNNVVDYTPPQYITLIFTDMGILTASAASDELLRFFN